MVEEKSYGDCSDPLHPSSSQEMNIAALLTVAQESFHASSGQSLTTFHVSQSTRVAKDRSKK